MDLKIKMSLNNIDLWEQLIHELQGTCNSLDTLLERNAPQLIDHLPFLHYLDNQIFCCEICNWWLEISEMADNDRWECRDCSSEDDY
jgi:hypothetical protein